MLHPGVHLALWGAAAAYIQHIDGRWLAVAVVAALAAAVVVARVRFVRLMLRARWLLLAIVVLFAFGTPGRYLWPALASFGPTADGLLFGAIHGARLTATLALVALLLETTPVEALVGGLYALLRPLSRLGFDKDRIAVRLLLVLEYSERRQAVRLADWLDRIDSGEGGPAVSSIRLSSLSLGTGDLAVLGLIGCAAAWAVVA